jgi:hypothetical protein
MTNQYNLLIPENTKLNQVIELFHSITILSATQNSAIIEPLTIALPQGFEIFLEKQVLTLSQAALINSRRINFTSITPAPTPQTVETLPIDQTGRIYSGSIRETPNSPILANIITVIDDNILTLETDDFLPPNCLYNQLPQFQDTPKSFQKSASFNLQDSRKRPFNIFDKGYYYNLDYTINNVTTRLLYGRVFVPEQ